MIQATDSAWFLSLTEGVFTRLHLAHIALRHGSHRIKNVYRNCLIHKWHVFQCHPLSVLPILLIKDIVSPPFTLPRSSHFGPPPMQWLVILKDLGPTGGPHQPTRCPNKPRYAIPMVASTYQVPSKEFLNPSNLWCSIPLDHLSIPKLVASI